MINIIKGNLLDSSAIALVNTVNTVGIMGKGIALQFKETFPLNNKEYIKACKDKTLVPGELLCVWDTSLKTGKKLIINFPTKVHWRQKSKYEYIEEGLNQLAIFLKKDKIESIALPPLGCGNGGLNWEVVKKMIYDKLSNIDTEIFLYEPNNEIKTLLQKQENHKEIELTPSRASLLYALFAFESLGEYATLFSANKLAYFLQRKGLTLNLEFVPYKYGPYAIGVEKVLYYLNGTYLKGLEQGQSKAFEPLKLNYNKLSEVVYFINNKLKSEDAMIVKSIVKFISQFSSELSLEILSSVDFILKDKPKASIDEIMEDLHNWNVRKKQLFDRESVEKIYNFLINYKTSFQN